jgi:hypothetical protein
MHNFLASWIAIALSGQTVFRGVSYVNSYVVLNHDMYTPGYAYLLLPISLYLLYNDMTWCLAQHIQSVGRELFAQLC